MNDLFSNKLFWVVLFLGAVLCVAGGNKVFVDVVANRVVEKLKQDYSPSPYGPGINPDKIDMQKVGEK